jgi:hypothetical protein
MRQRALSPASLLLFLGLVAWIAGARPRWYYRENSHRKSKMMRFDP